MTTRRRRSSSRKPALQIIPLGGLGEFGLNCVVIEYGDDALVVDAGLLFPEPEELGVDYVIPDFSYLFNRPGGISAILLTHGHEAHIGALPYLLDRLPAPVFGSAMTLGLVGRRLQEHGHKLPPKSRPVRAGQTVRIGPFEVRFLQVNHSIPGALALAIHTPEGTILHTGDFKLDLTPVDRQVFDFAGFHEVCGDGALVLLSDSTNVERPGHTPSESRVQAGFDPFFQRPHRRILIATFASHIHRIQQILDLAARHDRKVCLVGRSLLANTEVAGSLGYLKIPPRTLIEAGDLKRHPPERTVLVVTGSQGEPMSALSRMALDMHRDVKLQKSDLVILSARRIPGNGRAIARMVDHLFRRGAEVVLDSGQLLHTSGHASREELKIMYSLVRPDYFVPIHGDYHHLVRHADLIASTGHPRDHILLAVDGDVLSFRRGRGHIAGRIEAGRVFIETGLEPIEENVIRDRRHMSEDGLLMAVVVIDRQSGELLEEAEIVSRGLSPPIDREAIYRDAAQRVRDTLEGSSPEERADPGVIRAKIQADLKRYCRRQLKRHPMILPVIMEV